MPFLQVKKQARRWSVGDSNSSLPDSKVCSPRGHTPGLHTKQGSPSIEVSNYQQVRQRGDWACGLWSEIIQVWSRALLLTSCVTLDVLLNLTAVPFLHLYIWLLWRLFIWFLSNLYQVTQRRNAFSSTILSEHNLCTWCTECGKFFCSIQKV